MPGFFGMSMSDMDTMFEYFERYTDFTYSGRYLERNQSQDRVEYFFIHNLSANRPVFMLNHLYVSGSTRYLLNDRIQAEDLEIPHTEDFGRHWMNSRCRKILVARRSFFYFKTVSNMGKYG